VRHVGGGGMQQIGSEHVEQKVAVGCEA